MPNKYARGTGNSLAYPSLDPYANSSSARRARRASAHGRTEAQIAAVVREAELRNAQQPAARAPPEVLSDAFAYLPFSDLLNACHVCRYWRSVAVGCPSLWTDIRIRVISDGSSIDSANHALRLSLDRTAGSPLHISLAIGTTSSRHRSARTDSAVLFNLAPLAENSEKLRAINIDLAQSSIITGWNFVFDGPLSRLQYLTLRFAQSDPCADFARNPSFFACELPALQSLDLSGAFEFPLHPWDRMPSLRSLTLRRTSARVDLEMVSMRIVRACLLLESLAIYSGQGYRFPERVMQASRAHPALSSICLRGNIPGTVPLAVALDALGFTNMANIATHRPQTWAGAPISLLGILQGFDPVELQLLLPPRAGDNSAPGSQVVAWFVDGRGRTRAEIVPANPWRVRHSAVRSVARLTIDEALLDPRLNPLGLYLHSAQHLTIRLAHCPGARIRGVRPVRFQTAVYRGPDASPLWSCPALQSLELALAAVPGNARPLMLCNDICVFLGSTLRAPALAELVLCGFALLERAGDGQYERLLRCVSSVRAPDAPEPLAADRAWAAWKIGDDRSLPCARP
ncbi:hypothetical protein AURDEDRAFT_187279 [Auricularia subglabra TFB-10046 SS5]|nr:hypothetical protein AURDEDRAFT_187279 [Auricularia subglabra TFB-10046 SS5]